MQKIRVPLTNFQFGEVSPSLISRTDTAIYVASAQRVENLFLRSEGGVIKRAGLRKIYNYSDITYDSSKVHQSRLLPFIFSDDERYIISLEHQKIRVFLIDPNDESVSLVDTVTLDVDSAALPFTNEYLHEYTYTQAADVMFVCHPLFMPRQIIRTSLETFSVATYAFDFKSDNTKIYQPYYNFQDSDIRLSASAINGAGVTLTTTQPYFDTTGSQVGGSYPNSFHIGIILRYHDSEIQIISVQSTTSATANIISILEAKLDLNALEVTNGTATVRATYVDHGFKVGDAFTMSSAGGIGGISANNINGNFTVSNIYSENEFGYVCGGTANDNEIGGGRPEITTKAPTTDWYEQSFSALRGYPSAVTFHENRLAFAGTLSQPDSIWLSRAGRYYNFDVGDGSDTDSIHLTASIGDINQIRHLVSSRDLHIFSNSSELYVPAFQNDPIKPTNAQVKRQTSYGCEFQKPQILDGGTIFVQKGNRILREFLFTDTENAYTSTSITSLSPHLIKVPIEMSTLNGAIDRSESYVFSVNIDGTIAVFNSNRAEKRAGWTEFTSQGFFASSVSISDRVFANLVFDLGDETYKIILCEFDSDFNTDMASVYSGSSGVFDVSADFNDGAIVDVISGSNYVGKYTVSGGEVDVSTVSPNLDLAEIGYEFDVTLKTNPIDSQLANGPVTGSYRAISSAILDLYNTASVSVNETNLVLRNVTDDLSEDITPFSGKKEFRLLGYGRDPQITISQSSPLPLQINGLIAELIV